MFTRQIGELQKYRYLGKPWDQVIDVLTRALGNCAQTLEHRGPVIINGQDITTRTVLGDGVLRWAVAQGAWVNDTDNESYVDCLTATRDGTTGSNPSDVRVYLPRASGVDPNVQGGDVIAYLLGADGDAVVATDVSDDPLGTIKLWSGTPEAVPGGWRIDSDFEGRIAVGYESGSDYFDPFGTVGGDGTENPAHASSVSTESGEGLTDFAHTGVAIGSAGANSGVATGGTDPAYVEGWLEPTALRIEGEDTIQTSTNATGISIDDHYNHTHLVRVTSWSSNAGFSPFVYPDDDGNPFTIESFVETGMESTVLSHGPLDAGINDRGHYHTVSVSEIANNLRIEEVAAEGEETTPGEHSHRVFLSPAFHDHVFAVPWFLNAHTHDAYEWDHRHAFSFPHTHGIPSLPHKNGGNYMPMISKYFIKRVS